MRRDALFSVESGYDDLPREQILEGSEYGNHCLSFEMRAPNLRVVIAAETPSRGLDSIAVEIRLGTPPPNCPT